jgi:fructose-1,6-bisphosphatase II
VTGGGNIDMLLGIGGAPEGAISACATQALDGYMQGRIAPQSPEEMKKAIAAGHDLERIFEIHDLVASENTYFVATGVTDGLLLDGVKKNGEYLTTDSIILRARSGTIRRVKADYLASRWA